MLGGPWGAPSKDKPGAANRAMEILRAMVFRAEEWGLRERDTNPCLGIETNPRRRVARFLDADELAQLGRALEKHEARWPEAVAAIRLLALTGCRRGKVLDLRWRDIDPDAPNLTDSKTGAARGAARRGRPRTSGRSSATATRTPSCCRTMRAVRATIRSGTACARSARTQSSAAFACVTFAIPSPVRRSCRARTCRSSASYSVTSDTRQRRATPTLPTPISSMRRSVLGASLRRRRSLNVRRRSPRPCST